MERFKNFSILSLFCLVFAAWLKAVDSPNVILIMTDDQGWGDVGYIGHPHITTPALDEMAANGVVFKRFYSASPVCSPTRGSVLTGRHPNRFGINWANIGHLEEEEITLPELLKDKGYATGHFGKWHLGTLTKDVLDANRGGKPQHAEHYAPPTDHGYDEYFVTESGLPTWNPMLNPPEDINGRRRGEPTGAHFGVHYWEGNTGIAPVLVPDEKLFGDDATLIMDRAIPFIEKAVNNDQPFLSVIWLHNSHSPIYAGDEFKSRYSEHPDDFQHYYGVVSAMDDQVGRLRSKLKELGVAENTMIWFTSDNGPAGKGDSGQGRGTAMHLRGRKGDLYEGGVRVPGLLEWPARIEKAKVVDTPAVTSDYLPTILAVMDIDLPNRPYDGIDLMPFIEGDLPKRNQGIGFVGKTANQTQSYIDDDFKIYTNDEGKTYELYNLIEDESEENDISAENPKKLQELEAKLKRWKESVDRSAQGKDY
jgi:arylsulfatase A-like enzyme